MEYRKECNIKVNAKDGKCIKCGECCGLFIPVTKKEVQTIKQYVEKNKIKPIERCSNNVLEVRCPFLDRKNNKCNIYPVRPYVCRDFICSRKNWKQHRTNYHMRADFNGKKLNMYSMDELIYGDISMHIRIIIECIKKYKIKPTKEDFIIILEKFGRKDLLDKINIICEEEK